MLNMRRRGCGVCSQGVKPIYPDPRCSVEAGGVNNFSQDAKFRNKVAELNNNQEYQEYEDEDYKDLKALVEGFNTLLPIEEEQPGP